MTSNRPQERTLDDRLALISAMTDSERHTFLAFLAATAPAAFDTALTAWRGTRKRLDDGGDAA